MAKESTTPRIGIIDDERNIQTTLAAVLERRGYETLHAFNAKQGFDMIAASNPSLVLLDLGLPDANGLDMLKRIQKENPGLPVIVITAYDSLNNAIESIKQGAYHFISKPYVPEELLSLVSKALESVTLRDETRQLREETVRLKKKIKRTATEEEPVFKNRKMLDLAAMVEQVAPSDANVLLVGESGVGKEVFANRLHQLSNRQDGPLVKLNCAAFPEHMIEGELFGYKKGAFTGALQDFPGILSSSSGGTLFLDEIAEMPIDLQTRFLRVLQEREYRPLGSTQVMTADFRLIAASNRNPADAIRQGQLREDLYYRLNTFTFEIPPLRQRQEDILELSELFLERFSTRMDKHGLKISPEAYELLLRFPWPGNVRQLQNAIERAVVLARDGVVIPANLPPELLTPEMMVASSQPGPSTTDCGLATYNGMASGSGVPRSASASVVSGGTLGIMNGSGAMPTSLPHLPPSTHSLYNAHSPHLAASNGDSGYAHGSTTQPSANTTGPSANSLNLAEREKAALLAALAHCNGNKKKAAEMLGIHRPTLYTKLKKFGIKA